MKKAFVIGNFVLAGLLMFSLVEAQSVGVNSVCSQDMHSLAGIVAWIVCFLYKFIVPLLFALATVAFIWGVMQYYLYPENEDKRKKGKDFIIGGIIALFVMLSVWGLVSILTGTFDIDNTIPQLPGQ